MSSTFKAPGLGGIVGIVLGLIGVGIQMRWPEQRWLGLWFIVAGIAVLLAAIVWWLAQYFARREPLRDGYQPIRPSLPPTVQSDSHSEVRHGDVHINVGTIQQHAENVKQIQENLAKKSFSQPHIEFTNPEVRPRWIKPYGGLVKETPEPHSENHTEMPVMLARFYYKDEPNVPPEIKVTAKIAIADATGKPIKARYDGAWDEFTDSEYRRFATAQTRALIVALTPKMQGIMTWGFGRNAKGFDPDCEPLHGEAFLLAVDLIGKSEGEIVLQKPLKFRLTIDPPDLRLED